MIHGDERRVPGNEFFSGSIIQGEILLQGDESELHAVPFRELLPRDEIGMVLELCQDDFLPFWQDLMERVREQVDGFCRVSRENNFILLGADEVRHFSVRILIEHRRFLAQLVHPAVDIGVLGRVKAAHRVDDLPRLLRCGGAVQIGAALENWEVLFQPSCDVVVHLHAIPSSIFTSSVGFQSGSNVISTSTLSNPRLTPASRTSWSSIGP